MTPPTVLLIDDAPESAPLPDDVIDVRLDPANPDFGASLEAALENADLILIDQNLDLDQRLSLGALDGASFVGTLRSWARANDLELWPIAIYTSEYEAFADEIPAIGPAVPLNGTFIGREARIAPTLDVEWLIPKDENFSLAHVASLARDCLALRTAARDARMTLEEVGRFLAIPGDLPWSEVAKAQLAKWRPPINEAGNVQAGSRGPTPVLRWLLHQVLPCAGLLLSDVYAAWSLGIEPDDLSRLCEVSNKHEWATALQATRYCGAGKDLTARRWWAAGIDFMGWQLRGRADNLGDLQKALDQLAGPGIRPLTGAEKVVVVDPDFQAIGLATFEDAIQIHPPGWPSEAGDPWMRREEVTTDPVSQTMVDPAELPLTS